MSTRRPRLPIIFNKEVDEYFAPLLKQAAERPIKKEYEEIYLRLVHTTANQVACYANRFGKKYGFKGFEKEFSRFTGERSRYHPHFFTLIKKYLMVLPDTEEVEEARFLLAELQGVIEALVLHYMVLLKRLLLMVLSKNRSQVSETVLSESIWALLGALYNYNPSKGVAITTYISWWVKSMVGAVLDRERRAGLAPEPAWFERLTSLFGKKMFRKLLQLNRQPSPEVLEEVLGVWPGNFFSLATERLEKVSLYDRTSLEDIDVEQQVADPNDFTTFAELGVDKQKLLQAIQKLPRNQFEVLRLRFGLGCKEHSYAAIAKKMKISKSTAYEWVEAALNTLREELCDV